MHGFWIAFLKVFAQLPVVCAPIAVASSSQPTDPADPPPMASFLSLQIGTIASLSSGSLGLFGCVSASPRKGQSPWPGCKVPLLSHVETSNGTVIGNNPQPVPAEQSVVIVPVTAVACVVDENVPIP